jgi:hypothetical protein
MGISAAVLGGSVMVSGEDDDDGGSDEVGLRVVEGGLSTWRPSTEGSNSRDVMSKMQHSILTVCCGHRGR